MSEIPSDAGFAHSRRGFLKKGLGLGLGAGLGGLVAGCGRRRDGVAFGQPASGSTPSSDPPVDPTQPTNPTLNPGTPLLPNPQPIPPGSLTQASATITSTVVSPFGSSFVGLSFEKGELVSRIFSMRDPNVLALFRALGPGIMRIGGSSVDSIIWTPNGSGRTARQIAKVDIDQFAPFVRATGWQVIYGINLAQNTEASAAEEAAYAAQALGSSLYCFELGNEPASYGASGYSVPAGYSAWNYATFKGRWTSLTNAILQSVGGATFSGPDATAGSVNSYTLPFAREVDASQLKVLAQHYYRMNDTDARTMAMMLTTPDPKLGPLLTALKGAADRLGAPFRITETNSATSGGVAGVSDAYGSALWALDNIFIMALGGASGVHFHGGDTAKYSPFNFGSEKVTTIKPLYYGLLFSKMVGQGNLLDASINAGGQNISIYAIQTASDLAMVFVNKEVSQSFEVNVQLPGSLMSLTAVYLRGPGLTSSTGIDIQGASISVSGGLGAMAAPYSIASAGRSARVYVPALTAVLVKAS